MILGIKVSIIYPVEPSYIIGLLDGLSKVPDLQIEFLGSDRSEIVRNKYSNIKFINIRGSQDPNTPFLNKLLRIFKFYLQLFKYVLFSDTQIYHLHFPNKFLFLDFIIINLILKIRSKKLVYTAHNIDYNLRDKKQNLYKTLIFKIHYKIVDKIIVHNRHSYRILLKTYPFTYNKVSIIRIGLNIVAAKTNLSKTEARRMLDIKPTAKVLLFFGGINPYKGLEILIQALANIVKVDRNYLLLIVGSPRDKEYFNKVLHLIEYLNLKEYVKGFYQFIPDDEIEKYFSASDCCVLPYKYIFQSGVHVLSYSFGLPIIASDIGSFKEEDIIEGITGFTFQAGNILDLTSKIQFYFNSKLFDNLDNNRDNIINWAKEIYSWDKIGLNTYNIYKEVIEYER